MQDKSGFIVIGKFVGVYGVRGSLKIQSFTRPKVNIFTYSPWLIKQNGDWQGMQLMEGKPRGKGLIASIAGITDRDEAMALVGSEIAIKSDQLAEPKEGEYYWHDLINLQVINGQNEILGIVTELLETGANDVLVVEADRQRRLIPYVKDVYIKDIDLEQGIMQVDWRSDY